MARGQSIRRCSGASAVLTGGSFMLMDPDRMVWFGWRGNSLVRLDLAQPSDSAAQGFPALVRRVTVNQNQRSSPQPPRPRGASNCHRPLTHCASSSRPRRSSTRRPPSIRRCSKDSTTTGRRGPPSRGATSPTSGSATTVSTCGPQRHRTNERREPSTRSRSCRRGTAPGGRTAAISLLLGLAVLRRRSASSGGGCWPKSASARSLPRRGCAPRPPRRSRGRESEGKKQVELLSEIGRDITASLDFETIFGTLYERVNQLADADVFGVGLYHPDRKEIEYRLAIEHGKRYAPYSRDDDRSATSCRSGASSTASRCSSTTSAPNTAST